MPPDTNLIFISVNYQGHSQTGNFSLRKEFDTDGNKFLPLTLKAPITTAADDKFCDIFSNFRKNKVCYFMRIVCQQTILMIYHALFLFSKRRQNLKWSSAVNYRWRFRVKSSPLWYGKTPNNSTLCYCSLGTFLTTVTVG